MNNADEVVEKVDAVLKLWGISITRSHEMNPQEYGAWRLSLAKAISGVLVPRECEHDFNQVKACIPPVLVCSKCGVEYKQFNPKPLEEKEGA